MNTIALSFTVYTLAIMAFGIYSARFAHRTSTPAQKFVYTSNRQRFTGIGPFKRFGHGLVEVVNEIE